MRGGNLAPHELKTGERVPCVAMFGYEDAEKGRYCRFNPYPLAWATDDLTVIRSNETRIDEREWQLLYRAAAVLISHEPEIREDQLALFDKNGNLIGIE